MSVENSLAAMVSYFGRTRIGTVDETESVEHSTVVLCTLLTSGELTYYHRRRKLKKPEKRYY